MLEVTVHFAVKFALIVIVLAGALASLAVTAVREPARVDAVEVVMLTVPPVRVNSRSGSAPGTMKVKAPLN